MNTDILKFLCCNFETDVMTPAGIAKPQEFAAGMLYALCELIHWNISKSQNIYAVHV